MHPPHRHYNYLYRNAPAPFQEKKDNIFYSTYNKAMIDTPTITSLSLFGLMILIAFGYHLMGLAILKRGRTVDIALTTPLSTVLAGAGVFLITSVPLVYMGAPIAQSYGGFLFLAALLIITCRRGLAPIPEAKEMNRTLFVLLCLTFLPTLALISTDISSRASEWQYWLIPSLVESPAGTLPTLADTTAAHINILQHPPAWFMLPLFHHFVSDFSFNEAAIACNILLCILTLITMVRLCDLRIKWSNVAVVSGGLSLGFLVFKPLLSLGTLLSVQPDVLAGAALIGLSAPLLKHGTLPFKGQAGLSAFIAALLTLTIPDGIFYVSVLCVFWVLRSMKEPGLTRSGCIKGAIFIFLTALVGLGMWRQFVSGAWPWQWQSFSTPSLEALALIMGTAFLYLAWFMLNAFGKIKTPPSLNLVACYLALWLLLFIVGIPVTAGVLGFILLLPFWQYAVSTYKASVYARTTFASPWVWGTAMMGIAALVQVMALPLTQEAPLPKTTQISSMLYNKKDMKKIAIWDKHHAHDYANWIFMHTQGRTQAKDARVWASDAPHTPFIAYLNAADYNYLLVTAPDKTLSKLLQVNIPEEHLFLFRVTPEKLQLIQSTLKK